ncbi:hypothetical protein RN001_011276 [Aquatica leii]|uniref:Uncharacterized protein n=1 Tax=Aquatica leii TaxID=1421715 RepID=A0AAN7P233_9COLE|nr:hypothetical protein RN001_011276 [Aquatica leii]
MGKKVKKTRWRTLTLNGHQSDSEESCSKSNNQRKYSKFFYSSHSSPVRKFQNDNSNKTTRSNSTTSEQKTTFNEDEYTRITTPRQDVLFKKGYLNKPKSYQTQTSTGTCSTANSTSTCTPDHQSADGTEGTDLEYESQLVFPNGFIDHNGIYYINSFEPFPFVVYNAPICYPEYPRTKRCSTDSLTESVSPHNEESGATNVSNQPSDEPSITEEPRRQKKKRRRKISRSKSITSQESTDSGEVFKTEDETTKSNDAQNLLLQSLTKTYSLKPDAEEFVPRNLRAVEAIPYDANVQFVNIQPNFIPVPFINNVGELQRPPLVALNFIPTEPKLYPTYINVIPNAEYAESSTIEEAGEVGVDDKKNKSDIDIAKIVLKLEEAAKQQNKRPGFKNRSGFSRQRFNRFRNDKAKISEVDEKPIEPVGWGPKKHVDVISSSTRLNGDCSNAQRIRRTKTGIVASEKKVEVKAAPSAAPSPAREPRKPNQWISVSSRKKRRNKNATGDDTAQPDDAEDETFVQNDDLFESFDVNLLVDVVPPSQVNANEDLSSVSPPVHVAEVVFEPEPVLESTEKVKTVPTDVHLIKKKKKVQKILVKKVMVTDMPLPQEAKVTEPIRVITTPEVVTEVPTSEVPEPEVPTPEVPTTNTEPSTTKVPEIPPTNPVPEVPPETKTTEKKKKKKKKSLQTQQSVSSSNTTLNGDDSYDFLIENSALEEFDQKTNVEVSFELDRIIQKSMYTHLEEKMKSLNLSLNDEFFKAAVKEKSPAEELQASTSKFGLFQDKAFRLNRY